MVDHAVILTVTSGGLDTKKLGAQDWQESFVAANPTFPDWLVSFKSDLTNELGRVTQPVLLLWGDADPISPVAVGQRLLEVLPNARLQVIPGGDHNIGFVHAAQLAPVIDEHLMWASDLDS